MKAYFPWTRVVATDKAFSIVMFSPFDPAKNAIQGDAPEGRDTF